MLTEGETIAGIAGEYRVGAPRGEGGFAITHAGERVSDGAPVLLKELRTERLKDWKSLELFEREASALRSLSHPRIPKYYDFFAWDGARAVAASRVAYDAESDAAPPTFVLVQQRIEGRSLAEMIEANERMSGAEVELLLRGLLEIARYLHELHPPIIHRDINPNNVLMGEGRTPHLVDFGGVQDRLRLSSRGSTQIGTVGYMPIEQLSGAAQPCSDLYAIAMTVLSTVSHSMPHEMPIDPESSKVRIADVAPHLEPRVAAALDAMLEPIASRRPPSAARALALLDGKGRSRSLAVIWGVALGAFAIAGLAGKALLPATTPLETPATASPSPAPAPAPIRNAEELAFKPRKMKSTWRAKVKEGTRLGLTPGTACSIAADLETYFVSTRSNEEFAFAHSIDITCAGNRFTRSRRRQRRTPSARRLPNIPATLLASSGRHSSSTTPTHPSSSTWTARIRARR